MQMSRRQFLILTASAAGGCESVNDGGTPGASPGRVVNAGPAGNFASEGVYQSFCRQGFFVIRRGEKLLALSAICTHRNCELIAQPDRSFYCKCHGSTFDPDGHVTKGPARRALPMLSAYTNEQGQLIVNVPGR